MHVSTMEEIEKAISHTKLEFDKMTSSVKYLIKDSVNLFFDTVALVKNVARDSDDERYTLEVLATSFRTVLGSFTLLGNGFAREAHMLLRHTLELILIAIDITYSKESLEEWKKTINDELKSSGYEDWYFKKSKICKRVEINKNNIYPELEGKLVLGIEGAESNGICKEWEIISNISVHAHSQAQIRKLFDENGDFRLLGRKTLENYEKDFKQFRIFLINIITILIGIPKYRNMITKSQILVGQANRIVDEYNRLQKLGGIKPMWIEKK